jgi:hypothetical protein
MTHSTSSGQADEGMTKHEGDVLALAHARNRMSEVRRQNSSLFGNGRLLSSKDILLDLAGGCFWQLGHKLDSLGTLEVRQMITRVIAQLGFRRGRACCWLESANAEVPCLPHL